jgi:transposase-like protein
MSNKESKDSAESGSSPIPDELIDQLLGGYRKPEELTGPNGLIKQLIGKLVTRAMNAELDHHLGYEPGMSSHGTRARSSPCIRGC